ncbi:hypothetical protein ABZ851_30600 [Streptomyces sp. NPDC047049]|uniref:hypothetical protein n=1 Tax=Streptomyces sp. NPDC047049 TaxID=3156688 RepID=UPI0033FB3742
MPTTVAEQPTPTLESAIGYITLHATQEDLDRINAAVKQRTKALREVRAAAVTKGADVRLGDCRPKYMSGLAGKVVEVRQGRSTTTVDIELDSKSTETLRLHRNIPDGVERHRLNNVPASICHMQ